MLAQSERQAVRAALQRPRYELVPTDDVLDQVEHLPSEAMLTVTSSARRGVGRTFAVCEALIRAGFPTVPHVAARLIRDGAHLDETLDRARQAGMTEAFVVGGDPATPAGPFDSAGSLLAALCERDSPFERVGVAGYPEGHPRIDAERLWDVLRAKQPLASYVVTQMCFDAAAIALWVAEARRRRIHLPVLVGIPGATTPGHLMRVATKIGVGESSRFLRRHLGLLSRVFLPGAYQPDDLVDGLSSLLGEPAVDVRGFHIYTFNQVERTESWRRRALAAVNAPDSRRR
jgi:methylenetetrahydrofolate reductase (NADPH)